MAVESPVAARRAMTSAEEPSRYLDADAGSLDSIGRLLTLAEDEPVSVPDGIRILADTGLFVDDFVQLTGGRGDEVRRRMQRLVVRQQEGLRRLLPKLGEIGLEIHDWGSLNDDD